MSDKISRRQFIKKTAGGVAFVGLGGYNLVIKGCSKNKEYDLIISGGVVYDGLGNPGKEIDIAVKGDKIFLVGKPLMENQAKRVIDARGKAVSPGFIDAHTHTDVGLLVNPRAESYIRQGITTEISGNCGYSPFPIADSIFEEQKRRLKEEYDIKLNWKDIDGFFQRLEDKGMATNYATLLGHGSLRGKVVGFNDQPPTEDQIKMMKMLVAENMKAGALGLSTGLVYPPGSYGKTEEIIELCREVAMHVGIYSTHMRSEDDLLLEAMDEAITIAKEAQVSLQISHFKVAYPGNWSKIDAAISKIEEAKNEGINVLADRYPYIAGSTGLSYFFPLWARQGTTKEFMARLKNPDLDSKLRSYSEEQERKLGSWDRVLICHIFTEQNKKLEGKNIIEASRETGKEAYDFMRDLLIEEENRVGMILFAMNEDNLKRILAHPLVVIGSDGAAVAPYGLLSKGKPHPRHYGTFPRVLGKYVREEKIFTLSQAIQKMSSLVAQKFGLTKRGQLKEGFFADLVIFDPDKVIDLATWEDPHQYPRGIDYVIVNGKIVVSEGDHTGNLPGRILKRGFI